MKVRVFVLLVGIIWGCSPGSFSTETVRERKAADTSAFAQTGVASKGTSAESPSPGAVKEASPSSVDKLQAKSCNSGEYLSGMNSDGGIQCSALPAVTTGAGSNGAAAESLSPGAVQVATPLAVSKPQAKSCSSGEYVSGINADGGILCSALPAPSGSTAVHTTEVQVFVAEPNPPPPAPSCYMETTRWKFGQCKETCRNGGTQAGECTLISSTCSAAYKTGQCYDGSGSRMCCK